MGECEFGEQTPFATNVVGNGTADDAISPAQVWEKEAAKHAIDELFTLTTQYRASKAYHELLKFIARFRFYSPFNAMLIHVQMPGATFVAPPSRWLDKYDRHIKLGTRPLLILQPMGPVMFVFDVSDTEPKEGAKQLPPEIDMPFEVRRGGGHGLGFVTENAKRDGIRIQETAGGSQSAGSISKVVKGVSESQKFCVGFDRNRIPILAEITVKYDIFVNKKLSSDAQFVTVVHELAHLYCGHLGTPNDRWWPNRQGLDSTAMEFEAESVAYLVCTRFGIDNPSEQYLAGYVDINGKVPPISLECVMKAAGLIESMSKDRMKPRNPPKSKVNE